MEGTTNFSKRLQAVRNLDCWMFGNDWRNLKQFYCLPWLTWPPPLYFTTDPRHCRIVSQSALVHDAVGLRTTSVQSIVNIWSIATMTTTHAWLEWDLWVVKSRQTLRWKTGGRSSSWNKACFSYSTGKRLQPSYTGCCEPMNRYRQGTLLL